MKVICINNITAGGKPIRGLTLGKVYDVIGQDFFRLGNSHIQTGRYNPGGYWIKDDTNTTVWFTENTFMTLERWREEQIKKVIS
jgi:hypothetical protein